MKELSVLYDKLLVVPEERSSGLIIIPDASEKNETRGGRVVKTGRGYPLVNHDSDSALWEKGEKESGLVKKGFLPLSVKPGDYIVFFQNQSVSVTHDGKKYYVVPENAVVLLESDPIDNFIQTL